MKNKFINYILMTMTIVIIIVIYLILLLNINRGFDITDECFYILSIRYPELIIGKVSYFADYLKYLMVLSNNNVIVFRILGVAILLIVSIFSSYNLFCFLDLNIDNQNSNWKEKIFYIFVISSGCLFYYFRWLITPSYNWMQLCGSILVFGFIFYYLRVKIKTNINSVGYVLISFFIGFGGVLIFVANPLAALAIGILSGSIILQNKEKINTKIKILVLCAISFLFLMTIHIHFIGKGLNNFISQINIELNLNAIIGGGHGFGELFFEMNKVFFRLFNPVRFFIKNYIYLILFTVNIILIKILSLKKINKIILEKISLINGFVILSLFVFLNFNVQKNIGYSLVHFIIIYIIILLSNYYLTSKSIRNMKNKLLMFLVFLFPIYFRLGTNTNLINASFAGGYFYLILYIFILFSLISDEKKNIRYCYLFLFVIILFKSMFLSYKNPYRNDAISSLNYSVKFIDSNYNLYVSKHTKKWVDTLKNEAVENGWKSGNYLIDFTGGTPGLAVVLNAIPPGKPWLIGKYPGSDEFVFNVLNMIDGKTINSAWILTTPNGKRKISDSVLKKLGIDLNQYQKIVEVTSGHRNEKQILWKPNDMQ